MLAAVCEIRGKENVIIGICIAKDVEVLTLKAPLSVLSAEAL